MDSTSIADDTGDAMLAEPLQGEPSWVERLFVHGPESLSDVELSLVLTGRRAAGQLDQGWRGLRQLDPLQLAERIGNRAAARIHAAFELARRAQAMPTRVTLESPQAIYTHLAPRLLGAPRETFMVVALDARNQLLRDWVAMVGASDSCPVDPREVFGPAVVVRATRLVLAHNHPSGDAEPSVHNQVLTRKLAAGAEALHISLVNHLVIADRGYVSMQVRGMMDSNHLALRTGGRHAD